MNCKIIISYFLLIASAIPLYADLKGDLETLAQSLTLLGSEIRKLPVPPTTNPPPPSPSTTPPPPPPPPPPPGASGTTGKGGGKSPTFISAPEHYNEILQIFKKYEFLDDGVKLDELLKEPLLLQAKYEAVINDCKSIINISKVLFEGLDYALKNYGEFVAHQDFSQQILRFVLATNQYFCNLFDGQLHYKGLPENIATLITLGETLSFEEFDIDNFLKKEGTIFTEENFNLFNLMWNISEQGLLSNQLKDTKIKSFKSIFAENQNKNKKLNEAMKHWIGLPCELFNKKTSALDAAYRRSLGGLVKSESNDPNVIKNLILFSLVHDTSPALVIFTENVCRDVTSQLKLKKLWDPATQYKPFTGKQVGLAKIPGKLGNMKASIKEDYEKILENYKKDKNDNQKQQALGSIIQKMVLFNLADGKIFDLFQELNRRKKIEENEEKVEEEAPVNYDSKMIVASLKEAKDDNKLAEKVKGFGGKDKVLNAINDYRDQLNPKKQVFIGSILACVSKESF